MSEDYEINEMADTSYPEPPDCFSMLEIQMLCAVASQAWMYDQTSQ